MGRFTIWLGAIIVLIGMVFAGAWFVQFCWGEVIPAVLPGVVAAGYVAPEIGYWVAFLLLVGPIWALGIKSQRSSS